MEEKGARRPWAAADERWTKIEPLLPPGKPHPLGCHNPPVRPRRAMNALLFGRRPGCQGNALDATENCSSSSAPRRFFRRIVIRWEKKPKNYLAMLPLACALIPSRAAGLPR